MKRINNIYNNINDIDIIMEMYYNVRSKTKNKEKIERFEDYLSINIINIKIIISNNNYIPGKYNIFVIREPKIRVIMSQSMKDKVINHLVSFYFLIYVFDRHLVDNNIATRIGKGTHYGLKLFKNYYINLRINIINFMY